MKALNVLKEKKGMTYPLAIALFICLIILLLAVMFLINSRLIQRQAIQTVQISLDSYVVKRAIDSDDATVSGSGEMYNQLKNQDTRNDHAVGETVDNFIALDDTMISKDKFLNIMVNAHGYTRSGDSLIVYKDPAKTKVYYSLDFVDGLGAAPYDKAFRTLYEDGRPYALQVVFRVTVPYSSGSALIPSIERKMVTKCISTLDWKDEGAYGVN